MASKKRARLIAQEEDKNLDQQQEDANWDDPDLPASQMFHLQEFEFLAEFQDLTKTAEQRKFAESWIADRYVTSRAAALDMWIQLA